MREIARTRKTDQKQAPGLTGRDADRIVERVAPAPNLASKGLDLAALERIKKPKDLRDVAMLLVGRDILARANELVSLNLGAVEFREDGTALVAMCRGKTSTESETYFVGAEAAAALQRWIAAAGFTDPAAALFQGLTKGGKLTGCRLLPGDVGRTIKALGKRTGVGGKFSAHSLRVGMAQDLTADNIEGAAIMQAAGWTTPRMLTRYTKHLAAERGAVARHYAKHK
jgi:integrase